jgi:hypothetical protein
MFNYPIKTCDEETFLYYLQRVLRFFTTLGFKPKVLRSDYYTTFAPPKPTHFTTTTSAATKAPPHTIPTMAERSGTRHPKNHTLQRLGHTPRTGLPPRGRMAPRTVSLDPTTQRSTTLRHQVHTSSRYRPLLLHRSAPPIPLRIRRPTMLPSPRPRTHMEVRRQERHRILRRRRGQYQGGMPDGEASLATPSHTP